MSNIAIKLLCAKNIASKKVRDFLSLESGATAIEYGLIAALIGVVVIGTVTGIGTHLNTKFQSVSSTLAR